MKRILVLTILILSLFIIKIPKYIELNNLAIIESMGVNYSKGNYYVYLREIIPYKNDQGVSYKYKYYNFNSNSIDGSILNIEKKINKKIYLKKLKLIIINKKQSKKIKKNIDYKAKNYIYTNKNIKKVIREKSNY